MKFFENSSKEAMNGNDSREITAQMGAYFNNFSRGTQRETWEEFLCTFGGAIKELDKPYITYLREIGVTPANTQEDRKRGKIFPLTSEKIPR